MGMSICVESFLPDAATYEKWHGPRQVRKKIREGYLRTICETFGWKNPPWNEPSEVRGMDTSISASRFDPVWVFALAVEYIDGQPEQQIDRLMQLTTSKDNFRVEKLKLFQHLINRDYNLAYYIPVDFDEPIRTAAKFPEANGDLTVLSFSIGSSVRFLQEMNGLMPLLEQTKWADVVDAASTLREAAQESLKLNLPMCVSY